MFSHIFILYNKILSEANGTPFPTHILGLRQLCFLAPDKVTVQLHNHPSQQAGATDLVSHRQMPLNIGPLDRMLIHSEVPLPA